MNIGHSRGSGKHHNGIAVAVAVAGEVAAGVVVRV